MLVDSSWYPQSVRYAFGEPVVELIQPEKPLDGLVSETRSLAISDTMTIPLDSLTIAGEPTQPQGLLYHLPRSGSTLVSKMVAAAGHYLVLDEPPALNGLLSQLMDNTQDAPNGRFNGQWLKTLLRLFTNHASATRSGTCIKLSSWMCLIARAIHSVAPTVPTAFIYRDPLEVSVQVLNRHPGWMDAQCRQAILGDQDSDPGVPDEVYCVLMLRRFCEELGSAPGKPLHVNYSGLSDSSVGQLFRCFGITVPETRLRELFNQVSKLDSDDLTWQRPFVADSEKLRNSASASLKQLVDAEVRPALNQLLTTKGIT